MADLDRLCRELAGAGEVGSAVAIAAAIWRHGRWIEHLSAAGRTSRCGRGRPADDDTVFDLASLTKPITALTVARLARARALDIRAPLRDYLDETRDTAAGAAPLELVLAHRAGFIGHVPLFAELTRGRTLSRRAMLVEAAASRRAPWRSDHANAEFAPEYSDLGYLLAGEALARLAGASLDAVMQQHVARPIGVALGSARQWRARDAGVGARTAATEQVPWRGGVIRGVVHDENAWAYSGEGTSGHAGLFGTARDVLGIGKMLVDALAGRSEAFLTAREAAWLVRPRLGGTLRAGFDGKSARGSSCGAKFGPQAFGHLGFTGTSVWCDPEAAIVGVLLTNRVHPSREATAIRHVRPRVYDAIASWGETRA